MTVKPDPRVVLAGSRALPEGIAPRLVIRLLAALPIGATVLLRAPQLHGRAAIGDFEWDVAGMCEVIGLPVEWHRPVPTVWLRGRKSVWSRDIDMLSRADLCVCFYDVDQIGDEESGTVALVDKALGLDVPVYAYALNKDDSVIRVGEWDSKNLWAAMVPAA